MPKLEWDNQLAADAQVHCDKMAESGNFEHANDLQSLSKGVSFTLAILDYSCDTFFIQLSFTKSYTNGNNPLPVKEKTYSPYLHHLRVVL